MALGLSAADQAGEPRPTRAGPPACTHLLSNLRRRAVPVGLQVDRTGSCRALLSRGRPQLALLVNVLHLDLDGWAVAEHLVHSIAVEPGHSASCGRLEFAPGVPTDQVSVEAGRVNPVCRTVATRQGRDASILER